MVVPIMYWVVCFNQNDVMRMFHSGCNLILHVNYLILYIFFLLMFSMCTYGWYSGHHFNVFILPFFFNNIGEIILSIFSILILKWSRSMAICCYIFFRACLYANCHVYNMCVVGFFGLDWILSGSYNCSSRTLI